MYLFIPATGRRWISLTRLELFYRALNNRAFKNLLSFFTEFLSYFS